MADETITKIKVTTTMRTLSDLTGKWAFINVPNSREGQTALLSIADDGQGTAKIGDRVLQFDGVNKVVYTNIGLAVHVKNPVWV